MCSFNLNSVEGSFEGSIRDPNKVNILQSLHPKFLQMNRTKALFIVPNNKQFSQEIEVISNEKIPTYFKISQEFSQYFQ